MRFSRGTKWENNIPEQIVTVVLKTNGMNFVLDITTIEF